jgi:hypothetical protein
MSLCGRSESSVGIRRMNWVRCGRQGSILAFPLSGARYGDQLIGHTASPWDIVANHILLYPPSASNVTLSVEPAPSPTGLRPFPESRLSPSLADPSLLRTFLIFASAFLTFSRVGAATGFVVDDFAVLRAVQLVFRAESIFRATFDAAVMSGRHEVRAAAKRDTLIRVGLISKKAK